jgi:hypothetical protein
MADSLEQPLTRNIEPADDAASQAVPQGRNLIAVIGIDHYTYWPKLKNAVSDALGVQKLFVEKLGFTVLLPPLLNDDATGENILALITDKLPPLLQADDNLILFFAGHGHTRVSTIGAREIETGYLIPVNARLENWSDKLRTDDFLENVSQLPARHVLLILDACRSGFALSGMSVHRSAVTYEEKLIRNISRKVITSARRNEDALDNGPIPAHSLFTGTLIQGLDLRLADLDKNSLVTSFELGLYLQQQVGQASDSKQTPDFGSFNLDERGELVISLRGDTFDAVNARGLSAMLAHDVPALEPIVAQMKLLAPNAAQTVFLDFRLKFFQGDYDGAIDAVTQLMGIGFAEGILPVTRSDLEEINIKLRYWKPVLQLPATSLPVKMQLLVETGTDNFAPAPAAPFAMGTTFQVRSGALARYQIENSSPARAHLYFMTITPHGRMIVGPLPENDDARIDGIAPDASSFGQKFKVKGLPGIVENRILYSPQRVSELLFPATVAARDVNTIAPDALAALQMQPLFYQIVSDVAVVADVTTIRDAYSSLVLAAKEPSIDQDSARDRIEA